MPASTHISLSELQALIKRGIDNAHPLPYWVTAEISELKVNYSGHCYIELVEKGGANHVPKAKASAVIWRSGYPMIASYFQGATGQVLAAGLKVLVKVVVSYHELYGLSLQITDIDPTYTLGDMERQRQETIRRLRQDGVFDMNRELPLPAAIQRIAVISSRNAAGYQDFMKEISSSPYGFEITLFDAFMQGAEAEESIVRALGEAADRADGFDALVLIRGGGSQSDLGCFNSYRLCCYLAQFPLPVIAGIGHDKDQSVADLVAAVSLKTPTAVAVYLKNGMAEFEAGLDDMRKELKEAAQIDGAGEWQIYRLICMPLCKGALCSAAILVFIDYWNMVEQPLILLSDAEMHPLSVFLSKINSGEIGLAFAVATIYMVPSLLVFLYGEEYLVDGITYQGGVKG